MGRIGPGSSAVKKSFDERPLRVPLQKAAARGGRTFGLEAQGGFRERRIPNCEVADLDGHSGESL